MSGPNAHSFDRPRGRAAPTCVRGHWSNGDEVDFALEGLTLIVAIKPHCDGCTDFVHSSLDQLREVKVLIVSEFDDLDGEWTNAARRVLVAPETLRELDVKWPPFYVLVDPSTSRVITEGVVFAPAQVATEIAPHLTSHVSQSSATVDAVDERCHDEQRDRTLD